MHPNPEAEVSAINISGNVESFKIYNLLGILVFESMEGNNSVEIDNVANITLGTYLIQVKSENGSWQTQKLIISESF
jgi:hypothetical protein